MSGGKSSLSGGWADHLRPVWAEPCIHIMHVATSSLARWTNCGFTGMQITDFLRIFIMTCNHTSTWTPIQRTCTYIQCSPKYGNTRMIVLMHIGNETPLICPSAQVAIIYACSYMYVPIPCNRWDSEGRLHSAFTLVVYEEE